MDMKKYLYSNGLPFNSKLPKSIDDLKLRIQKKKPSLMIISGGSGEGKSTLGIHCAEYYQGSKIDYSKQYGMGGEDFQSKLRICIKEKLPDCIYDEAGDYNKRGFWTKLNRNLNRIWDTYRTFGILIIIILPNFSKLDNNLFDNRIPRLLLHCENRDDNYGEIKVYGLWRMMYLKAKINDKKLVVKSDAYKYVRPNYRARFKNLVPKREKELDVLSSKGKLGILEEINIDNKKLLDYKNLAKEVGRSVIWVRSKVNELNIKAEMEYKRKKYFSRDVVFKLEKFKKD